MDFLQRRRYPIRLIAGVKILPSLGFDFEPFLTRVVSSPFGSSGPFSRNKKTSVFQQLSACFGTRMGATILNENGNHGLLNSRKNQIELGDVRWRCCGAKVIRHVFIEIFSRNPNKVLFTIYFLAIHRHRHDTPTPTMTSLLSLSVWSEFRNYCGERESIGEIGISGESRRHQFRANTNRDLVSASISSWWNALHQTINTFRGHNQTEELPVQPPSMQFRGSCKNEPLPKLLLLSFLCDRCRIIHKTTKHQSKHTNHIAVPANHEQRAESTHTT